MEDPMLKEAEAGGDHDAVSAMMAQGSSHMHARVVSAAEAAMGRALPRMEVRFRDLALSATVHTATKSTTEASPSPSLSSISSSSSLPELPTIPNEIKKMFRFQRAPKKTQQATRKTILHPISGAFKPGTMTLVLGQPGSGKSSLLKLLSGRFPVSSRGIHVEGDITYNGESPAHVLETKHQQDAKEEISKESHRQSVQLSSRLAQSITYVTQRDTHLATLTVRETLAFAHKLSGEQVPPHLAKLLDEPATDVSGETGMHPLRALFKHFPDIVLHQLGLESCQNTVLGNSLIRGVSGGEKKRVTLGEMAFGFKTAAFLDEVTTGLDSAAAFDIMCTQRSLADTFQKTIVASLLQPTPEVFALFDDVILLNQGHVMYYGPRDGVMTYFADLGFTCPGYRDTADFLMDLATSQQYQYELAAASNASTSAPQTAAEFSERYKDSSIYKEICQQLEEPHDDMLLQDVEAHMAQMPRFQQSFVANTRTLLHRQLLSSVRNTPLLIGRIATTLLMGFFYATVFGDIDRREIQVVMGTAFASVLYLALGQFAQLPTMMDEREVFYKQRRANMVRTPSYTIAFFLSQVPMSVLETLVFGSLTYWFCGFADSVTAYINFELLLLFTSLFFSGWFMLLSAWATDLHFVEPVALATLLFYILFAGFVLFKSQMPSYLEWLYWVNPLSWSLRGVAVNEYRSASYDVCEYKGMNYCGLFGNLTMGEYYLSFYDIAPERYWVTYAIVYMAVCTVIFVSVATYILEYHRKEIVESHESASPSGTEATGISSNSNVVGDGATVDDVASGDYTLAKSPRESANKDITLAIDAFGPSSRTGQSGNFIPVTLAFTDLRYSVPDPHDSKQSLELLKGISGFATPGSITALMGSSGAGKTTLMDVIAGRKTAGKISGSIMINGHKATDLVIRRATGYCEQTDVHLDSATYREALTFSAFLRQSSESSDAAKYDSVQECLELLDLVPLADQVIRGSSIEQLKRLTIGVELAAQPSVLFLDEPTSGLDARSAKVIMDGVRKVADSGRTVVCTIHQPSAEIVYLFDSLLLLKKGGETVYFGELGEKCQKLIEYFESIPGVERLAPQYNPATWMLETIGAGVGNEVNADVNFVEHFKNSHYHQALIEALDRDGVTRPSADAPVLLFSSKRAASAGTQIRFLLRRSFNLYWRSATYNLTRVVVSLCVALLFWLLFNGTDYTSFQGINSGVGMIFLTSVFMGIISFNSVLPIAVDERNVYYRERAAQTYNALWFFLASTLVEIPYVFASGLVFTVIFFPSVGFEGFDTAVLYWVNISALNLMQTYFGLATAYALPTVEVAMIVGVLANSTFMLFMGFVPPAAHIPAAYKWLYYITPQRYSLAILSALVFSDCDMDAATPIVDPTTGVITAYGSNLGCQVLSSVPSGEQVTVKGFVEGVYELKHDEIGTNFLVVLAFIVIFRILGLLALRYINHQQR